MNKEKDRIIYHELDNPLPPDKLEKEVEKLRAQIEENNRYAPIEVSDEDLNIIFGNIPEGYGEYDN
jgi:hypothetical protein